MGPPLRFSNNAGQNFPIKIGFLWKTSFDKIKCLMKSVGFLWKICVFLIEKMDQ